MLDEKIESVFDDDDDYEHDPSIDERDLAAETGNDAFFSSKIGLIDEEVDDTDFLLVPVDWVEFEGALENNSPDLKSYLNIATGDVIRVFDGSDKVKEIDPENSDEYLLIDPISSRDQYHWMEEFIETVEESSLKDKLNVAIDGKGAFRRFKDVLMGYPVERERWFSKRSTKLHAHMSEWIKIKHIKPGNIPPWDEDYDQNKRFEDKKSRGEPDQRPGWRDGQTDLRAVCRELVDLIPSRELPTAVAFLEFLRGRRGFRRLNHP